MLVTEKNNNTKDKIALYEEYNKILGLNSYENETLLESEFNYNNRSEEEINKYFSYLINTSFSDNIDLESAYFKQRYLLGLYQANYQNTEKGRLLIDFVQNVDSKLLTYLSNSNFILSYAFMYDAKNEQYEIIERQSETILHMLKGNIGKLNRS